MNRHFLEYWFRKRSWLSWLHPFSTSRLFRKLISFSEELEELDLRYNLIGDLGGKEVVEGLKIRNRGKPDEKVKCNPPIYSTLAPGKWYYNITNNREPSGNGRIRHAPNEPRYLCCHFAPLWPEEEGQRKKEIRQRTNPVSPVLFVTAHSATDWSEAFSNHDRLFSKIVSVAGNATYNSLCRSVGWSVGR